MSRKLSMVVAVCKQNRGIGIRNELPWKLRGDMDFFKKVTSDTSKSGLRNAVIMGRKTWDSIPAKMRPLRNRFNIVLSRTLELPTAAADDVRVARSFEEALGCLESRDGIENVYVIGGEDLFKMTLEHPSCHRIYLTEVLQEFECDVFFPEYDGRLFVEMRLPWIDSSVREESGIKYRITCQQKVDAEVPLAGALQGVPTFIVNALDLNRGIGFEGRLPWPHLGKDYLHYTGLLRGNDGERTVAIIGRKSWESSMPEEKVIPNVLFVVVSEEKSLQDYPECCCVARSFQEAVRVAGHLARQEGMARRVAFLGGHRILKEAINGRLCDRLYLTRVLREFPSDVFFPTFEHLYALDENTTEGEDHRTTLEDQGIQYKFEEYKLIG